MKTVETCWKCTKREMRCHSTCKEYLEAKASLAEEKEKIYEEKKKSADLDNFEHDKRHRLHKEWGRH